jgi:trehalose/maltose hydrolase-like predicted phosphorylase
VTVCTSQEVELPVPAAQDKLAELSYGLLLTEHQQAWQTAWQHSDIEIGGNIPAQLAVRYNLFQLFIAGSSTNDRVSVPAKTLSGFGYRGHIFWDTEIFILPFFTFTQPQFIDLSLSHFGWSETQSNSWGLSRSDVCLGKCCVWR